MILLTQLQAMDIPKATTAAICDLSGLDADKVRQLMDTYLSRFVDPRHKENQCLQCGGKLDEQFVWGIQHGEGRCRYCDYPMRAVHVIEHEGKELLLFNNILRYHPAELTEEPK